MAQWRKVVVSGSSPEFANITGSGNMQLDGDLIVAGGDITLGSTSIFSGGDTTSLNNIDALDATTEATIESAIDTLGNLTAASSLVTVSTLDSGAISSGFGNIDIGTSTLNAGNTTLDNVTNNSAVGDSHFTGSFSGSYTGTYTGDGSGLSGIALDIDGLSALGGTGIAQGDKLVFSDAGTEKSITFSNFEDAIFGNVSSDITIAAGGAATIANDSVDNNKLANIAQGSIKVGGGSNAPTDLDAKTDGQILVGDGTDVNSVAVSGDVTLANNGAVTIAANAVEGSMLNSNVAGTGIDYGSNQISVDVSDFMTNGSNNRVLTATGTDAQNAEANLTFDGSTLALTGAMTVSTNMTIEGNLDVNGSLTTIDSTNLKVADRFIIAASGSSSGDGGLIVETSGAGSGSAFAYDDSASRWALSEADGTGEGDTTIDTKQYIVSVSGSAVNPSGNPSDFGGSDATRIGMMHVNTSTGEIFIFS